MPAKRQRGNSAYTAAYAMSGNQFRYIKKDSPLANINLFKSTAAVEVQKHAFTENKQTFEQEVVVLSTDDIMGGSKLSASEQKANMFGLAPAVKAARYDLLSAEPELDDILERMVDECIVYDSDSNQFCDISDNTIDKLKWDDAAKLELKNQFKESFDAIYYLMSFNGSNAEPNRQDVKAMMREYLVRGRLAFEIVYDDVNNPNAILGFKKLNAFALTPMRAGSQYFWEYDKSMSLSQLNSIWSSGSNISPLAMQTGGQKVRLLDSQVIFLQWNSDGVGTMSYLERLVRAFNLLRIIERTRVAWAVTNSRFRLQATIPTKGKTKAAAQETLRKAMNKYHEKIEFDDQTGELSVNGSANIPMNTELWVAETNSGSPRFDAISTGMPNMSDSDAITYFRNNLQRLSKMPLSRFDDSGGTWNISAESIARDERRFGQFIDKLITRFGVALIVKPTYIDMCLHKKQYIGDSEVMNSLQIKYNKYNQFQVSMELQLLQDRIDAIDRLKDSLKRSLTLDDTEQDFWSLNFLIDKYLEFPQSELDKNAKMLKQEIALKKKLMAEQAAAQAEQERQEQQFSNEPDPGADGSGEADLGDGDTGDGIGGSGSEDEPAGASEDDVPIE